MSNEPPKPADALQSAALASASADEGRITVGSRPTAAQLQGCLQVLDALRGLDPLDPDYLAVERAAAHLIKGAKKKRRLARRRAAVQRDRALVEQAVTAREDRAEPEASGAEAGRTLGGLHNQRRCYVCKAPYRSIHAFYHGMCAACGDFNLAMRGQRAGLEGRRALVTGGRIKIGFRLALKLLRDGAHVQVTTRFPRDAARRFAQVADADAWRDRLQIHGLDLKHLPSVVAFAEARLAEAPLDILINNAAQTVRRPASWSAALYRAEADALGPSEAALLAPWPAAPLAAEFEPSALAGVLRGAIPSGVAALEATPGAILTGAAPGISGACSAAPGEAGGRSSGELGGRSRGELPGGADLCAELDEEGVPVDRRAVNSWVLQLSEVSPVEMVEAQIVGSMAPFVLCSVLRASMARSPFEARVMVNVSAVEGQFGCANKTSDHPHTNMAKAALNMLTRTSAASLSREGIYMCSVDTGWITDEKPMAGRARARQRGFIPPLDVIDGAARVYDPVVRAARGEPAWGVFLKDYRPAPW